MDLTNPDDADWIARGRRGIDVEATLDASRALGAAPTDHLHDRTTGGTLSTAEVRDRLTSREWTVDPDADDSPDRWVLVDADGERRVLEAVPDVE